MPLLYKSFNCRFTVLIVFNAIDSPDIVPFTKQPRHVTLEYCFISISLYTLISFPDFIPFCVKLKSIRSVFSSLKWIPNLFSINHWHKLEKILFKVAFYCTSIFMLQCLSEILYIWIQRKSRKNTLGHTINILQKRRGPKWVLKEHHVKFLIG